MDGQLDGAAFNPATPTASSEALLLSSPAGGAGINTSTAPVAIPPLPRVSSPYYSPSQVFPPSSTNKSYFPTYLSQSAAVISSRRPLTPSNTNDSSNIARSPSSTSTSSSTTTPPPPPPQQPKTPRSPSFFSAGASTTTPSPRSPLFLVEPAASPFANPSSSSMTSNPTAASPLSGKPRSAALPTSARTYHAYLAQQQLAFQMQQRELIYQATRAANSMGGPISPRLIPLGSPGPVTPLTLEDNPAGYLMMPASGLLSPSQVLQLQQHHLEKLAAAAEKSATATAEEETAKAP
ncbi:hypothetical protein H072_770 [Dactylellina haptotyla CBS 200.50]|uniref:Uncharacterized protein n=1 Tax=Dactylellina haptotyla (strain CBS 200.50) TaxID=1284197 RepID=S8C0H1_DACHA|nr:hypothetical protein H072_770 [Dactylellina haptotyla CBS 200.50]